MIWSVMLNPFPGALRLPGQALQAI